MDKSADTRRMDKSAENSQHKPASRCVWSGQKGILEEVTIAEKTYGVLPEYLPVMQKQLESQRRYERLLNHLLTTLLMLLTFSFLFNYLAMMKTILLMMWLLVFVFPWLLPLDILGMRRGLWAARASAISALVLLFIFL